MNQAPTSQHGTPKGVMHVQCSIATIDESMAEIARQRSVHGLKCLRIGVAIGAAALAVAEALTWAVMRYVL